MNAGSPSPPHDPPPDRLPPQLESAQAEWLAPFRARLLRRADVARRRTILDLGAGSGTVAGELARRAASSNRRPTVVALDRAPRHAPPDVHFDVLTADAARIPLRDGTVDLLFTQTALLWMPLDRVIPEICRVLAPSGVVVAVEPDYGGLIEHPPAAGLADIWRAALSRAGADPEVARKLPARFRAAGLEVEVHLIPELHPPDDDRFEMLAGLPLTEQETRLLDAARTTAVDQPPPLVHLPFFGLLAFRR